MKPEIILLLDMGIKPKTIAEKVGVTLGLVYYYNRQYKTAKKKIAEIMSTK